MSALSLTILAAVLGADPGPGRQAVERGLTFLTEDAVEWRAQRKCVSCHHGLMTLWTLSEARSLGYAIGEDTWSELTRWTIGKDAEVIRDRILPPPVKPNAPPPTYHVVSLQTLLFTQAARTMTGLDAAAHAQIDRFPVHITEFQKADGSWSAEEFPAANRPPPTQESPEVLTLWAYLALRQLAPSNDAEPAASSPTRASLEKASTWLSTIEPGDSSQVAALRLLAEIRAGQSPEALKRALDRLRSRQNADGGWSPTKDLPSDAYATGQALYALGQAEGNEDEKGDRPEIDRGVAFLVANQREEGSWPMTPRAHPGAKPFKHVEPIEYFGTAWATLGLMRSLPK